VPAQIVNIYQMFMKHPRHVAWYCMAFVWYVLSSLILFENEANPAHFKAFLGGFSGVNALLRIAREESITDISLPHKAPTSWLEAMDSYQSDSLSPAPWSPFHAGIGRKGLW